MMKMTLNGSTEFEIKNYNRYTNIQNGKVTASANFNLVDASDYDKIVSLNDVTITEVKIENDEKIVYDLKNQHAHVVRINENVYDGGVNIDVGLTFDDSEEE